jgi:hypothetical protein
LKLAEKAGKVYIGAENPLSVFDPIGSKPFEDVQL